MYDFTRAAHNNGNKNPSIPAQNIYLYTSSSGSLIYNLLVVNTAPLQNWSIDIKPFETNKTGRREGDDNEELNTTTIHPKSKILIDKKMLKI